MGSVLILPGPVADVFSGFFYLLDDAFRVGEYLQAGSVSGAVEAITLRNVMLRHHRGMLQIVPYSELGAIANFMRGGIVVKFNLENSPIIPILTRSARLSKRWARPCSRIRNLARILSSRSSPRACAK